MGLAVFLYVTYTAFQTRLASSVPPQYLKSGVAYAVCGIFHSGLSILYSALLDILIVILRRALAFAAVFFFLGLLILLPLHLHFTLATVAEDCAPPGWIVRTQYSLSAISTFIAIIAIVVYWIPQADHLIVLYIIESVAVVNAIFIAVHTVRTYQNPKKDLERKQVLGVLGLTMGMAVLSIATEISRISSVDVMSQFMLATMVAGLFGIAILIRKFPGS